MASFDKDSVFDCIVIGLGGHGSATVAEMATRGLKVLGIEQFGRIHENGLYSRLSTLLSYRERRLFSWKV